jgi:hypothetical protein
MSTLTNEIQVVRAQNIVITVIVDLTDGRTISVPLAWYPRLLYGTPEERNKWRLIGQGKGIHWPDLDEDISIEGLQLGRLSGESQRSFKRWLDERAVQGKPVRHINPFESAAENNWEVLQQDTNLNASI